MARKRKVDSGEDPALGQQSERKATADAPAQAEAQEERPVPAWVSLINMRNQTPSNDDLKSTVNGGVKRILDANPVSASYNLLFLVDELSLQQSDADRLYRALGSVDTKRSVLLVLSSDGGSISTAYFIGKLLRERTRKHVAVAVPRRAKSAATLICCAADEIHMGSLSELGPIDPQFSGVPALALKHSIEHLAELVRRYPAATEMFASYMAKTIGPEELGYYERVAESAAQYADRLLVGRSVKNDKEVAEIAHRLVYTYKDHGFVIDSSEAKDIFGDDVVKIGGDVYSLSNALYGELDMCRMILRDLYRKTMYFTGAADSGCNLVDLPAEADA